MDTPYIEAFRYVVEVRDCQAQHTRHVFGVMLKEDLVSRDGDKWAELWTLLGNAYLQMNCGELAEEAFGNALGVGESLAVLERAQGGLARALALRQRSSAAPAN